jgi:hypothetical protein
MGLIDFSRTCSCTADLRAIRASLVTIITNEEKIMTALADLQAADTALKDEVATFLTDVAAALTSAGTDPAAIEAVVTDINTEVAALKAGDPAAVPPVPVPPTA